ncbi:hypothetical protein [Thauera sp.]|uniref:hypothetical protein n=1 Tax=Thauera sp. TaxID=1905334 RepID=UPI002BCA98E8|nr:hypothetical protein [Thauera sp.]HRP25406.1 hypothetical protein [Thauera sp.]
MLPFLALPMMADARHTVAQVDSRNVHSSGAATYASVNFGAPAATRGIVVFAWMADVTTPDAWPSPACTIAGVTAQGARYRTWSGAGRAVGVAIFAKMFPTGTSASVFVDMGGPMQGIVVLRVTGYDLSAPVGLCDTAGASDAIEVPEGGLLLAVSGRRGPNTNAVDFNGVVRRGSDVVQARRDWGWSHRLPASAARPLSFSPYSGTHGDQAWVAASFAPL